MLDQDLQTKLEGFINKLKRVQPNAGKDIGLIVSDEISLGDLSYAFPNSDNTASYSLDKDTEGNSFIRKISSPLRDSKDVLIKLEDYLNPKVYNQLRLISKSSRVQYFTPDGDETFQIPDDAMVVILTTQQDLDNLNYDNILDIVGPVLRI